MLRNGAIYLGNYQTTGQISKHIEIMTYFPFTFISDESPRNGYMKSEDILQMVYLGLNNNFQFIWHDINSWMKLNKHTRKHF